MEKGFLELFLLQTKAFSGEWQSFLGALPEAERQLSQQMGSENRRRQFVIGRHFLRKLAKEKYDTELAAVFAQTDSGKVFVPGLNLQFNISHTDEALLIGFSDSAVGVDIESLNRPLKVEVLARYEQDVGRIPSGNYIEHWCLKESYAKATGKGLGPYLRGSHFDLSDKSFSIDNEGANYSFFLLKTQNECISACVQGQPTEAKLFIGSANMFQESPYRFDHLKNRGDK